MANVTLQSKVATSPATPVHVSVPVLGFVTPDWRLHRPWLQFYVGLTGFDLRSLALGIIQTVIFGGYAGALTAAIFNFISRRFG